jgi:predicted ATPase/signal transduction histidine kinase/tRNA A-37 threonylcarbamoyl transferase component Bud32
MLKLEGFTLGDLLDDGANSAVYRARDEENDRSVVIKTYADAYPSAEAVARMEHEFDIGKGIHAPHVVGYYGLESYASNRALIVEDFGATSLARVVEQGPLDLRSFLHVARESALALEELHSNEVVHRDVSPSNILWNQDTGEVKIGDLGLATLIPRSKEALVNPGRLQGTLAYISPEQTGRMNRVVDFRTDFYSLGATLWYALTGAPPFSEKDAMALIHAHIAKAPPELRSVRDDVPEAVADVIHLLLAKTAEERYQSAAGIAADLEHCLSEFEALGTVNRFELRQSDTTRKFRISEKLYGREAEVDGLIETFERVANGGRELLLVRGLSGIGKSMLVNEVHKPMVARSAYFAAGKYDQLGMTDPLSGILQALRDLVRQLLTEDDEVVATWREAVLEAVGDSARVLTNLMPEIEAAIGEQPEMLQLGPVESRERFERALLHFILATATARHPLVLFLDDLQWVDPASLRVLSQLVTSPDADHTLVICAYRDNEVPASHPFALALEKIREEGISPTVFTLAPLELPDLAAFVADSLERHPEDVTGLAEVIQEKTGGNPFYVTQFLSSLADNGLVEYDEPHRLWDWDMKRIGELDVIESVVDLMLEKIERYEEQAQSLLSLASCVGNQFDLETLSIIAATDPKTAARGLWQPVRDGLLLPVGSAYEFFQWSDSDHGDAPPADRVHYRFAHDRVQQAAYRGIADGDTEEVHLRIGRLLLAKSDEAQREERVFDLVNHLNIGRGLIESSDEQRQLAQLNLQAAQAASEATAFDGALEYVRTAMDLLPADSWKSEFQLTYDLHRERAEGEFLAGNWDEATAFFERTIEKVTEPAQIAELYQLMIRILLQADRVFEATDFALQGCRALGLHFPEDADEQGALIAEELETFDRYMRENTIDELLNQPLMDDPATEQMLGVLHETWSAAVMSGNGNVVIWSAIKTVTLALERGNSAFTAAGYIGMSHVLSLNKRLEEADAIGRMAMELAQRFDDSFIIPKVNNTYCNFTNHFVHHMRDCVSVYEESYRRALLGGDTWWGAWAAGWLRVARLVCGVPLAETLEVQEKFHDYIVSSAYKPLEMYSSMDRQITLNFMGRTVDPLSFTSDDYDESEYVTYFEETGFGLGLHLHWIYKAIAHWMNGAHEATPALLDEADKHVDFITLTMPWIDHYFFSPLCAVHHVGSADKGRDAWARQKVQEHLAQLREWEQTGKENFTHRAALVEAEWQRVSGNDAAAVEWYQKAIAAAREYEYLHHEAMANELAARHHLAQGREQAAVGYILEAHALYSRWGAAGKVKNLESEFPRILRRARRQAPTGTGSPEFHSVSTSSTIGLESVDLNTVLKASVAISSELNLSRLIERLMDITMENAGAQRGVLLLETALGTTVEAVTSVDDDEAGVLQGTPLSESSEVPHSIIDRVRETHEALVLADARESDFSDDPYLQLHAVRSVLCLPIVKQQQRLAVLYLENHRATSAFPPDRVAVIQMICTEAAVAIENARLYDTLEQKVADRTQELAEKNAVLEEKTEQIMTQQTMLVHSEKMASLGQLVAGVAHELNNPINFISSGLPSLERDLKRLAGLVPEGGRDDRFDKVMARISKLVRAIEDGASRTAEIVQDLRSFSRLDEAEFKGADIHEALDSTLTLLRSRLREGVEVVKNYGELPQIYCAIGQINQVMMNVLTNAIQAMGEQGVITITTRVVPEERIQVSILDTGAGMTESVRAKIFDPFYTTKEVGDGTGLGLSISHGLIERHQGTIEVKSELGEGTEFLITLPILPEINDEEA